MLLVIDCTDIFSQLERVNKKLTHWDIMDKRIQEQKLQDIQNRQLKLKQSQLKLEKASKLYNK
jgi:hypothetical protein